MRKNFFWVALTAIAMLFLLMTMAHAKAAHEPVWRLSEGLGSGWKFEIELTFDAKGLVSKFTFACRDAA